MSKSGWYTHFQEPIPVPKGEPLVTLRDAGAYITRLSKTQYDHPAWQNAMYVLIRTAEHGDPVEFARLGMMQALYLKGARVYDRDRKDQYWGRRKLARDR
ncbi:MAG: hypothetical protein JWR77_2664 [Rhizorhabdus sp.]|jgi:hypothetical protein|nr:hypothetical protein [Rhizorhabdus sp.]